MATIQLMNTTTLTFTRDDVATKGYYDTSGEWVAASTVNVDILGSLQPYRGKGVSNSRDIKDMGYVTRDLKVFYCKDAVYSANEFSGIKADRTTIDGLVYDVISVEHWVSIEEHYMCVLALNNSQ